MKPIIIFKEKNKDGAMSFTQEELEQLLTDAYDQGYVDGQAKSATVYPYWIGSQREIPTFPDTGTTPDKYFPHDWKGAPIITCNTINESHSVPNPNIVAHS